MAQAADSKRRDRETIHVGNVEIGKDQARFILGEMSDGHLWPFLRSVMVDATKTTADNLLEDTGIQQHHTEELFRAQGERLMARDLMNLPDLLRDALTVTQYPTGDEG
jgi:hypothetical protein